MRVSIDNAAKAKNVVIARSDRNGITWTFSSFFSSIKYHPYVIDDQRATTTLNSGANVALRCCYFVDVARADAHQNLSQGGG